MPVPVGVYAFVSWSSCPNDSQESDVNGVAEVVRDSGVPTTRASAEATARIAVQQTMNIAAPRMTRTLPVDAVSSL
jgi:hypothetical protein